MSHSKNLLDCKAPSCLVPFLDKSKPPPIKDPALGRDEK